MLALKNNITTAFQTAAQQPMPTTLVDMIADYAYSDYAAALERYDVHKKNHEIISTDKNKRINEAIQHALTSFDCDPRIKTKIFSATIGNNLRRGELVNVIAQIQASGVQIVLDNTDLSGCDLSRFDLRGMSAQGASFVATRMAQTALKGANLTCATFFCADISHTQLHDTILANTRWTRSLIVDSDLHRVDMTGANMTMLILRNVDVVHVNTGDPKLQPIMNAITKQRGPHFNVKLTGIVSSVHGFRPGNVATISKAVRAIRTRCYDTAPDFGLR